MIDGRSRRWSIEITIGAPLRELGHDRLRHPLDDLVGVDRVGQDIVDLGEVLGTRRTDAVPTPTGGFSPRSRRCRSSTSMANPKAPITSSRSSIDDDVTDSFDPVNRPVRPRAAMVEPERLTRFDAGRPSVLDHLAIIARRRVRSQSSKVPSNVGCFERRTAWPRWSPSDGAGAAVPRPLPHAPCCQRRFESICSSRTSAAIRPTGFPERAGVDATQTASAPPSTVLTIATQCRSVPAMSSAHPSHTALAAETHATMMRASPGATCCHQRR